MCVENMKKAINKVSPAGIATNPARNATKAAAQAAQARAQGQEPTAPKGMDQGLTINVNPK